jgi:hypothetical protein
MRLSHEKTTLLAHQVTQRLVDIDEVTFVEDRETIRQTIKEILVKWLRKEELVDAAARRKIETQQRKIPEGSSEWEILYRKYYEEELRAIVAE